MRVVDVFLGRDGPADGHDGHMHEAPILLGQQFGQARLGRLGHGQGEDRAEGLMDDGARGDEEGRMGGWVVRGHGLQVRQEHGGGDEEAEIGHFVVRDEVVGRVLVEGAVSDASCVVDDHFGHARLGHGSVQGVCQSGLVRDVGRVGPDRGGRRGLGHEPGVPVQMVRGAGEEGDAGKGVGGEEPSDVGADHGARPNHEHRLGTQVRCHSLATDCQWKWK